MARWREATLVTTATVKDAVLSLSKTGKQIVLVIDESDGLLGVVTDGDIRKALLNGQSLETRVSSIMNSRPRTAQHDDSASTMIQLMRSSGLQQLPITRDSRVVGLVTLAELTAPAQRVNTVVLMAGGRGQRLRPLTDQTPKPLLTVRGRPILETIIAQFVSQGFSDIVISLNYLGETIKQHFGDGRRFGASIRYLNEDEPLGTAGALSLLGPSPNEPFVVMNGDILTQLNFTALLDFHLEHKVDVSIVVREDEFRIPYGVVSLDGPRILSLAEKPVHRFFANAGIYVLNPSVLKLLRHGERLDMTELVQTLLSTDRRVAAFPLHEYWIDIGHSDQLQRAEQEWADPEE